jgi:hypothetical protein
MRITGLSGGKLVQVGEFVCVRMESGSVRLGNHSDSCRGMTWTHSSLARAAAVEQLSRGLSCVSAVQLERAAGQWREPEGLQLQAGGMVALG